MRKLCSLLFLFLLACAGLSWQATNLEAQYMVADTGGVILRSLPAPTIPSWVGWGITGVPGVTVRYYWVSAIYPQGETRFQGPLIVTNSNAALTGANYIRLMWYPQPGALSFNVVRTATAAYPATGAILRANVLAPGQQTNDTGAALGAYVTPLRYAPLGYSLDARGQEPTISDLHTGRVNYVRVSSQFPSLQAALNDAGVGGEVFIDQNYTGLTALVLPRRIYVHGLGPQSGAIPGGGTNIVFANVAGSSITVDTPTTQDYVVLEDLTITGANAGTPRGLDLTNAGIIFLHRVVMRSFYDAIYGSASPSVHLNNCNISSNLRDGLQLNAASNSWRIQGGLISQNGRYGINVDSGNDNLVQGVRLESNVTQAIRANSDAIHLIANRFENNGVLIDTAATNSFLAGNYYSTAVVTDNSTAVTTTQVDSGFAFLFRPPSSAEIRSDSSVNGANFGVKDIQAQAAGTGPKIALFGVYTAAGGIVQSGTISSANVSGTTGHYDFDMVFSTRLYGAALAEKIRFLTTGGIAMVGVAQANLGAPVNGTIVYCNDCTIANPCAAAGAGAFAKRLNGVCVCN
jgi:hypothetical protein